ncbi:DUF2066 domain-containing protein [Alteromonas sediminis]|nr:DUF2066 domain-containing protein [Alteromonas sediminis]
MWVLLFTPIAVNASSIVSTNVGEVVVSEHSNPRRAAFSQVIIKMTGDPTSVSNAAVREALRQSDEYLASYEYLMRNQAQIYRAVFDRQKVQQLIKRANLPLWGARRPDGIVWLAVNSSERIGIVSDVSPTEQAQQIKQSASGRGINLLLPLMDLEDTMAVGPTDVWGRFMPVIERASSRYRPDFIIAARIGNTEGLRQRRAIAEAMANRKKTQAPVFVDSAAFAYSVDDVDGFLQRADDINLQTIQSFEADEFAIVNSDIDRYSVVLDWTIKGEDGIESGQFFGDDDQTVIKRLIDFYADKLADLYAISVSQTKNATYVLNIANIQSLSSSVSLSRYLADLTVVQDVRLTQIEGKVAAFNVVLLGELEDLITTLALDKKLIPIDQDGIQINAQSPVINLYWDE